MEIYLKCSYPFRVRTEKELPDTEALISQK